MTRNEAMTVPPRTENFTSDRYPSDHHHPGGLHSGGRVVGDRHPTERRAGNPSSSTPTAAIETDPDEDRLSLSATQVVASMAAAVTAAFLGSRLGVAGTVIGAGLASVVTVVGSAVFGHSLLVTRQQVTKAVRQVRHADDRAADAPTAVMSPPVMSTAQANDDRTNLIPAVTRYDLERARLAATAAGSALSGRTGVDPSPGKPKKTRRRIGTHLLVGVAATAAIFAGSLAAVTVVETVKGSPLSGGDSGGLSVLGGNGNTDQGTIPETATTTEVSTVTSTVTSPTATSAETEPTTSSVATTSPSDDSTPMPSSTPTSPSASSSGITPKTTAQASTDAPSDAN